MSAPAGLPPRPAGAAAAVYPSGPGASREAAAPQSGAPRYQNGPVQSHMQFPSGYDSHPPNYNAPSGHYSQVPNKAAASHLDNQYRANYYPTYYPAPAQNVMTPSVGTSVLNTQESQQLYNNIPPHTMGSAEGPIQGAISSASYLHTSAQQSYAAFGNHYSTSVSSSVTSQGFPLNSDHYTMPMASSAMYPNVSYPVAAGSVYGQAFTSQTLPAPGQFKETNTFSSQSTSVPRSLQQHVPMGYNTTLATTSSAQSTQDNLCRNLAGSVSKVNNQINTGGVDSSQPVQSVSQNILFTKPGTGTSASSPVISPVRTPAPSLSSKPQSSPSVTQSPEPGLQEAIDSSSTTSSASPVLNNYDALEGGGYPETRSVTSSPVPASSAPQTPKASKPFGYGYPALQPGYQNAAPTPVQPSNPGHHPGFQHYTQQYPGVNQLSSSIGGLSLQHSQQPESLRPVNLTQDRNILPVSSVPAPVPNLNSDLRKLNCSPE